MASLDTVKIDLTDLVSALQKFQQWQAEYADIQLSRKDGDTVDQLMDLLGIPSDHVSCLIGGSNAPIFKRAADEIRRLRELVGRAVKGLKHIGEFHYPDDEAGVEPHTLDCTLAGRVSHVFCTGMTRSCELCHEFGEDPEFSEAAERQKNRD